MCHVGGGAGQRQVKMLQCLSTVFELPVFVVQCSVACCQPLTVLQISDKVGSGSLFL